LNSMDECGAAKSAEAPAEASAGTGELKARLLNVIAAAEEDEVVTMLDQLWSAGQFCVQRAPRTGLIMYTVRDPFDTPFHLGEVLVSEAQVVMDGYAGCGMICGDEPKRALLLAAVEAAERSGRVSTLDGVGAFIDRLEKRSTAQTARLSKIAAATEVRFESMKKETVDFGSLGE
jgi:alpha-D-ribose 1-methylphosphonate 5-triphosphate synthase subunit PhnG